eukprot:1161687-Pelagomonas_calceolata.AAC.1
MLHQVSAVVTSTCPLPLPRHAAHDSWGHGRHDGAHCHVPSGHHQNPNAGFESSWAEGEHSTHAEYVI